MKRLIFAIALTGLLAGCGWNLVCTKSQSYEIGSELATAVGSSMFQSGCFAATYEPRFMNRYIWRRSPIVVDDYEYKVQRELIYSGRNGDTLHLSYREYTFNDPYLYFEQLAKPSFYQQVFYDLSTSKTISFQDWLIEVIKSDNEQIKFKVVKYLGNTEPFYLFEPLQR